MQKGIGLKERLRYSMCVSDLKVMNVSPKVEQCIGSVIQQLLMLKPSGIGTKL